MALGSTQSLTEIFLGINGSLCVRLISPPFVSRVSRKYGSLDIPQPYGPTRPITEIALPLSRRQAMTRYCLFLIEGSREPGQITCCRLKRSRSVSYARSYIDNDTKIQECWTPEDSFFILKKSKSRVMPSSCCVSSLINV